MLAYFRIDKERRLVMSTISGVFARADGLANEEKLLKGLDFALRFSRLLDWTQVTKIELRPEDMRGLAQRSIFSSDSHRAILVGSDLAFGSAQMSLIFPETTNSVKSDGA
jgi:hypothetical protein